MSVIITKDNLKTSELLVQAESHPSYIEVLNHILAT